METTKYFTQLADMNLGFDANPHPENGGAARGLRLLVAAQAIAEKKGFRNEDEMKTDCPGLVPSAPGLEA